ncbi:hypothetical protein KIH39_02025 [Telmatocola sphagniphila]|uniref:Uncharacterized protein n=1 Tax=Telmatocola sphagniphila TaxID=1123043 RepID=A0A8E6B7U4_9BACT|nr:hypothetical protein [Telmatocola sphagniphila]QVL32721.1 hypothetical protein KIH39_02025 [Telmatocola sphagniphila]
MIWFGYQCHRAEGEERVSVAEIAEQIQKLKSSNTVEVTTPRSGEQRIVIAEEPVTKRLRKRMQREQENPQVGSETYAPIVPNEPNDYRSQVMQNGSGWAKELVI